MTLLEQLQALDAKQKAKMAPAEVQRDSNNQYPVYRGGVQSQAIAPTAPSFLNELKESTKQLPERLTQGLAQSYGGAKELGAVIGNRAGLVNDSTVQGIKQDNENIQNQFIKEDPEGGFARGFGQAIPYLATAPIGVGEGIGGAAANTILGGLSAAAQHFNDERDRALNAAGGAFLGAIGSAPGLVKGMMGQGTGDALKMIQDRSDLGLKTSVGEALQNKTVRGLEQQLAGLWGIGGKGNFKAEANVLRNMAMNMIDNGVDLKAVNQSIPKTILDSQNRMHDISNQLFNKVGEVASQTNERIPLTNYGQEAARQNAALAPLMESAQTSGIKDTLNRLQGVSNDLQKNGGVLDPKDLMMTRQGLNSAYRQSKDPMERQTIGSLINALDKDVDAFGKSTNNEALGQAIKDANSFYKNKVVPVNTVSDALNKSYNESKDFFNSQKFQSLLDKSYEQLPEDMQVKADGFKNLLKSTMSNPESVDKTSGWDLIKNFASLASTVGVGTFHAATGGASFLAQLLGIQALHSNTLAKFLVRMADLAPESAAMSRTIIAMQHAAISANQEEEIKSSPSSKDMQDWATNKGAISDQGTQGYTFKLPPSQYSQQLPENMGLGSAPYTREGIINQGYQNLNQGLKPE